MILTDGIALAFLIRTAQVHKVAAPPLPAIATTRYGSPTGCDVNCSPGIVTLEVPTGVAIAIIRPVPVPSTSRTNQP